MEEALRSDSLAQPEVASTEALIQSLSSLANELQAAEMEDDFEDDEAYSDSSQETERALSIGQPRPYTLWTVVRSSLINLVLPFVNGLMLGFGEIFAHELGFRWGWAGVKVSPARQHQLRAKYEL